MFLGIGLGFLAIQLTLIVAAVVIRRSQQAIERQLGVIVDVEEPTSAAAYEMEINVLGAGLAVQKYLRSGDAELLERYANDEADFARYRAEYGRLATTPEERALAGELDPLHARYRAVGGALRELRDLREEVHTELSTALGELDALVAPAGPQAGSPLGALGTWLGTYLLTSRERYRERVLDELRRAKQRVAGLSEPGVPDGEPGVEPEVASGFERVEERLGSLLAVQDALVEREREFRGLREELDALIDERIQARTRADLLSALDDAKTNLLRLRRSSLALLVAAGLVSLFAGVAAYQGTRNLSAASADELRQASEHLRSSEARRGTLLRRLVSALEEERARIARELHDQMGQDLAALSLGLASLQRRSHGVGDAARDRELRALQELTQRLAEEVHEVALRLRPPLLDDLGLHDALANLVETWSRRTGVAADIYSELQDRRLPHELETTLFRIVQEALTNVGKHSGARSVDVVLKLQADLVRLVIEDDGCGFDVEEVVEHGPSRGCLGLLGARERVEQAGGTLEVESAPGKGTSLVAHIPIPARDPGGAAA